MTTTTDSTSASSVLTALTGSSSSSSSTASTSTTSTTGSSSLGKDAFLQLLVTQMQNQNPLDPQDNSEFVSQLAQFSSLESMQSLNDSVSTILTSYQSSQALQASSLVGHSVVVTGTTADVDTSSTFTGSVNLTDSSTSNTVGVYNSDGTLVRTLDEGTQSAGVYNFTWDGKDGDGNTAASGLYTFKAVATVDGTSTVMTTNLPTTVSSVTMATTSGGEMTLNLATGSSVALSAVKTIGS